MVKIKYIIKKIYNKNSPIAVQPNFQKIKQLYLELIENKRKLKPNTLDEEYTPVHGDPVDHHEPNEPGSFVVKHTNVADTSVKIDVKTPDTYNTPDIPNTPNSIIQDADSVHDVANTDSKDDGVEKLLKELQDDATKPFAKSASPMLNGSAHKSVPYKSITRRNPPKLSTLLNRNNPMGTTTTNLIPNLTTFKTKTAEENAKRQLQHLFENLELKFPNANIPNFTVHSDYKEMKYTYDRTLRKVKLTGTVHTYRKFLSKGFKIIEFILGYYFGFDMQGFSTEQDNQMDDYHELLVELGEKSYMPGVSQYPVELRLAGLILFNTASFVFFRNVAVGFFANTNTSTGMKGPSITH